MGKRWRRLAVATVAVLLVPVGIGRIQPAYACTCAPGPQNHDDQVAAAHVVFDGVATQVSNPDPQNQAVPVTYRFDVSNVVKGVTADPQDVLTGSNSALCGQTFELGRAYRIFAHREGPALSTGVCSGNRHLTGYRLAGADGGVFAFGASTFHGSAGGLPLNEPVVGLAATPTGRGYWLAAADGGVFAYGDARFFGSTGGLRLNAKVVGITASPTGRGYWLVAADGGIFAYGDARFFGSAANLPLRAPVVGIAANGTGSGYWLLGADGGIFAYGGAGYFGRKHYVIHTIAHGGTGTGATSPPSFDDHLATGIAASPRGNGYWISSEHGEVTGFGDTEPLRPHTYIGLLGTVGVARTSVTPGLAVASPAGRVITYNGASSFGDLAGRPLNAPLVAISA